MTVRAQGRVRRVGLIGIVGLIGLVTMSCHPFSRLTARRQKPPAPPTYSQYHLEGFGWNSVARVLVLPVLNESEYTKADKEVQAALTSELQRLGRFEVIAAPRDENAVQASEIHRGGRFNEDALLALGRATRADVILHATVTHYSPYPRPRMGLILQAVGPLEAKVVASVDGLWDSTDAEIAERTRTYYRQRPKARPPWIRNHVIASDDSFAEELALDSPALFQRFVSYEAVCALTSEPMGRTAELEMNAAPP